LFIIATCGEVHWQNEAQAYECHHFGDPKAQFIKTNKHNSIEGTLKHASFKPILSRARSWNTFVEKEIAVISTIGSQSNGRTPR
jgi:hypothetical protein